MIFIVKKRNMHIYLTIEISYGKFYQNVLYSIFIDRYYVIKDNVRIFKRWYHWVQSYRKYATFKNRSLGNHPTDYSEIWNSYILDYAQDLRHKVFSSTKIFYFRTTCIFQKFTNFQLKKIYLNIRFFVILIYTKSSITFVKEIFFFKTM